MSRSFCQHSTISFKPARRAASTYLQSNAKKIGIDAAKFDKQMKYANKRAIPFVILPGEEERAKQLISLKNFTTGEQQMLTLEKAISILDK